MFSKSHKIDVHQKSKRNNFNIKKKIDKDDFIQKVRNIDFDNKSTKINFALRIDELRKMNSS